MKSSRLKVYVLLVFSMLIWGFSFIFTDILFDYFSPISIVVLRVLIATLFMFILSLILKKLQKIEKKDIKLFLLFALFDPFGYFICESYGLKLTSPTTTAVVIATIPLFTPFSAIIFLKEKISMLNVIGIIVSFAGVLLVVITKNFELSVSALGLLFLSGAVFTAVLYNFFLRKLAQKYNVFTIITVQNICSSLLFMPLFIIYTIGELRTVNYDLTMISSLILLSVFASSLAFIFYANSIKVIGITKTNVFTNSIPIFTAIFSYFVVGEVIGLNKILGIALVMFGLFLSQLMKKK